LVLSGVPTGPEPASTGTSSTEASTARWLHERQPCVLLAELLPALRPRKAGGMRVLMGPGASQLAALLGPSACDPSQTAVEPEPVPFVFWNGPATDATPASATGGQLASAEARSALASSTAAGGV